MNLSESTGTESESTRALRAKPFGLWSAVFLVVANMIGAGVFTTSGFSLADLGDRNYVLLAWLAGGLIAICGAVSYGQLAQRIAESGGEYLYLSRFVHPCIGFLAGWVSLLAGFTGAIAFAATAFESYAFPESIRPVWFQPSMAAIASIVFFGALHSLLLRVGLTTQNLIVILKVALLVGFVLYAFLKFPTGWEGMQIEMPPAEFSIYAIASTLVWISLSFSGFNAAIYVTGEVDEPKRNVPRALLLGTLIVTLVYLTLNFIFVYAPDPAHVSGVQDIAAVSAAALGGDWLTWLVRVIVSVALLSSVSSMLIAGPRVYAKMAEDGVFPHLFKSSTRKELQVPTAAIWLQIVLACIVVYFTTLKSLLDYLGFTLSVSAALTAASILWTRRENETSTSRGLFAVIAFVYVAATLTLATLSAIGRPQQLTGFVITVIGGLILYLVLKKSTTSRN